MKYVNEYRDARLVQGVIEEIRRIATRRWVLMEIRSARRWYPPKARAPRTLNKGRSRHHAERDRSTVQCRDRDQRGPCARRPAVAAAYEMLGFDPLYIANEGKLIVMVARRDADKVLQVMRTARFEGAVMIGEVYAEPPRRVLIKTRVGSTRVVDVLMGELLPRIC